ncbi:hypothetical protein BBJ28_00010907 [Nothophytophthora sp. Chile5]|nr:hypothetical protein BBJ28_00010907 [Nothophytophthora sp. Chile5]
MAFLCPGVSVAQISARLGLARYSLVLSGFVALYLLVFLALLWDTGVLDFLCVAAAVGAAFGVAHLRTKTRTLFFIPGNFLQDVASAIVCGPCAIAQMASHVEAYHPGTCSFRARSTLEGYVRQ